MMEEVLFFQMIRGKRMPALSPDPSTLLRPRVSLPPLAQICDWRQTPQPPRLVLPPIRLNPRVELPFSNPHDKKPGNPKHVPELAPVKKRKRAASPHEDSQDEETSPRRNRATPDQLRVLEDSFTQDMLPNAAKRRKLAEQLGFPERRVQVWFQNRRAALKKKTRGKQLYIIQYDTESFRQ